MSNRQIRKDEISSRVGTIQISHTRDGNTRKDRSRAWGRHSPSLSNRSCLFKGCEKEKVRVVRKSPNILSERTKSNESRNPNLHVGLFRSLEQSQFNNWRRIYRTAICVRLRAHSTGSCSLGLLKHLHAVFQPTAILQRSLEDSYGFWNLKKTDWFGGHFDGRLPKSSELFLRRKGLIIAS